MRGIQDHLEAFLWDEGVGDLNLPPSRCRYPGPPTAGPTRVLGYLHLLGVILNTLVTRDSPHQNEWPGRAHELPSQRSNHQTIPLLCGELNQVDTQDPTSYFLILQPLPPLTIDGP